MPCGLRVHDRRGRPGLRDGVGDVHRRRRDHQFHGTGTPHSIQVRTGRVRAFEGSRCIRDGDDNLPGAYRTVPNMHAYSVFRAGTYRITTFWRTARVRGSVEGLGGRETFETCERTGTWPL